MTKIKNFCREYKDELALSGCAIAIVAIVVVTCKTIVQIDLNHMPLYAPDESVTISDVMTNESGQRYFTITENSPV